MANDEGKIGKVEKVGAKSLSDSIAAAVEPEVRVAPNKEHFDALLTGQAAAPELEMSRKVDSGKKMTLIDEVAAIDQRVDQVSRATPQQLATQAEEVIGKIEGLKKKLETPNLEVKDSMQGMLRNKLTHIDESLKVALSRAGIEYTDPVKSVAPSANPIERFLGLLTRSQSQLETLTNDLHNIGANRTELSPATMLMLQVKVGFVQQEVELFTSLLSKALESTKTIMNVQV